MCNENSRGAFRGLIRCKNILRPSFQWQRVYATVALAKRRDLLWLPAGEMVHSPRLPLAITSFSVPLLPVGQEQAVFMSNRTQFHAPPDRCWAEHMCGLSVLDVVALATAMRFKCSRCYGTWPVNPKFHCVLSQFSGAPPADTAPELDLPLAPPFGFLGRLLCG